MGKIGGLSVSLDNLNSSVAAEFQECISDLINLPEIQELNDYSQHAGTSRYQHSLNVSYYSFLMAKSLGCDYVSAARGGLLHDLFYYNFKSTTLSCSKHAYWHPRIALENAKSIANLNKVEEDIIIKHMWPMTGALPKYKESFIVTVADKYCATYEVTGAINNIFKFLKFTKKRNDVRI